jgi:hypothetical protein
MSSFITSLPSSTATATNVSAINTNVSTNTYTLDRIMDLIAAGFEWTLPSAVADKIAIVARDVGYTRPIVSPSFPPKRPLAKGPNATISATTTSMNLNPTNHLAAAGPPDSKSVISLHLNKLSASTAATVRTQLMQDLATVSADKRVEVAELVFGIASGNKAFVQLYADLFKHLAATYDWLLEPLVLTLDRYGTTCADLFFNSSQHQNKPYAEFCRINAMKDRVKTNAAFFVALGDLRMPLTLTQTQTGSSVKDRVLHIIGHLVAVLKDNVGPEPAKQMVAEEAVILLLEFKPLPSDIKTTLTAISKLPLKTHLSNKAKFSLMNMA